MKSQAEVLNQALEAFWAEIVKNHPERETGDLDPVTEYDLENWAQHAYEIWLKTNKPVYYVQRTMVQILKIEADDPGTAEDLAQAENWGRSIDTEVEYLVLDKAGKVCG